MLYPLVFIASQSSSHDLGPRGSLTHYSQTSVGLEHMFSDSSIPGQKEIETSHGLSTKPNNVSLERVCVFVCWLVSMGAFHVKYFLSSAVSIPSPHLFLSKDTFLIMRSVVM